MTAPDPSVEASDDVSEVGENETLAGSPTTQPDAEAEPDAVAVAAEAAPSEPAAVESAVEPATPTEVPTRRRAGAAPAWAWVAITIMALLLASGLTTLAVVRNADPSAPEAVEDVQTLVVELEALNGYLATTNQLMSDAITNAEYMSANVQAKLAGTSAQLGDVEAGVGHARSLLGSQLSGTTLAGLGRARRSFSLSSGPSRNGAGARGATARSDQPGCRGDRQRGGAHNGPGLQSRERCRGSNRGAREQPGRDRGAHDSDDGAPGRRRAAQDGSSSPAGACASPRRSTPGAEAGPRSATGARRHDCPESVVGVRCPTPPSERRSLPHRASRHGSCALSQPDAFFPSSFS